MTEKNARGAFKRYFPPNRAIKAHQMDRTYSTHAYKTVVGRRRRKEEDNIKLGFRKIGFKSLDWIYMVQGRVKWGVLVNMVMGLQVPQKTGNFLTIFVTISFSRKR
jgi:hypothetical protein